MLVPLASRGSRERLGAESEAEQWATPRLAAGLLPHCWVIASAETIPHTPRDSPFSGWLRCNEQAAAAAAAAVVIVAIAMAHYHQSPSNASACVCVPPPMATFPSPSGTGDCGHQQLAKHKQTQKNSLEGQATAQRNGICEQDEDFPNQHISGY